MEIIETPIFTKLLKDLEVSDEDYRELQGLLVISPDYGDLIIGTGGARKVRMKRSGGGKRGGHRVIYYWKYQSDQIYMLLVYSKGKRDDLTPNQKKDLKNVIEEIRHGQRII